MTDTFVDKDSIVGKIWGKADNALFIFAGAAAEFALNKAVDWLYFTGRLPADPLGRLFSTVAYAHRIIFSGEEQALAAIDQITAIHSGVERARGFAIPDWAYRDVLFLLIDYTIRSFELLERPLLLEEKEEVFNVFYRVGERMGLAGLPRTFDDWLQMRSLHLQHDLVYSNYTADLYVQYKKHLGKLRFAIMKQVQYHLAPARVSTLLGLKDQHWLIPILWLYKMARRLGINRVLRQALLPAAYKAQINALDKASIAR